MPILADDEETWPRQVRKLFEDNFDLFKKEIDWDSSYEAKYLQGDWRARYLRPSNPFSEERDSIVDRAEAELRTHRLVGYHCCRLLDCEVEGILREGMAPLSPELVARKIATALEQGHLTAAQAKRLQEMALLKEDRGVRNGMIWFVFCRSTLRTAVSGLYRLLGYWGGEAIYFDHEGTELGQHLATLGKPRVIEAEIPVPLLKVYMRTADRLLGVFLWRRKVELPNEHTFEGHATAALSATMIRKVHAEGTHDFETLTEYSTWGV